MLLSTCPNCGAKFRVSPDQLNVRQGRVMCGRCRHVFNAFESLKRIEDDGPGEAIDMALLGASQDGAPPHGAAVDVRAMQDMQATDPAPPVLDTFDSFEEAAEKIGRVTDPGMQPLPLPASPPAFVTVKTTSTDVLTDPGEIVSVAAGLGLRESQIISGTAEPSVNPLIAGPVPTNSGPARIWAWLAALAAIVLALQCIYAWRSQIAQRIPEGRPHLVTACALVGCSVPWGRDEALIKIEASELIEPPGKPGRILLNAAIVNRAQTRQDFPALEVKLSDSANNLLASRVLLPSEYLGRVPAGEESLAPGAELYVNLNLELSGEARTRTASGYGLRAFYP